MCCMPEVLQDITFMLSKGELVGFHLCHGGSGNRLASKPFWVKNENHPDHMIVVSIWSNPWFKQSGSVQYIKI